MFQSIKNFFIVIAVAIGTVLALILGVFVSAITSVIGFAISGLGIAVGAALFICACFMEIPKEDE